jgi:hypothetical protein
MLTRLRRQAERDDRISFRGQRGALSNLGSRVRATQGAEIIGAHHTPGTQAAKNAARHGTERQRSSRRPQQVWSAFLSGDDIGDWFVPSSLLHGRRPRSGGMLR